MHNNLFVCVVFVFLLAGQEAVAIHQSSSASANAISQFDILISLAERLTQVQQQFQAKSKNQNAFSLGELLHMLPQSNKTQFAHEFGPTLIQLAVSAMHESRDVEQAVKTAQHYVDTHANGMLSSLMQCVSGETTSCDLKQMMGQVINHFTAHHNMSTSVQVHSGRPIPAAYTKQQSFYLLTVKAMFWISTAIVEMFHIFYISKQEGLIQSRESSRTFEQEKRRDLLERWQVIQAVFPSAREWVDVNKGDPAFSEQVEELCESNGNKNEGVTDDNSLEVDECWERMKGLLTVDPNMDVLVKRSKLLVPQTLVAFFAFALLLSNGAASEHCDNDAIKNASTYYCSNGSYQNSICVLTCQSAAGDQNSALTVIDPSQSTIMVCSRGGKWMGGPSTCLTVDTNLYDPNVPLLTSGATR